MAKETMIGSWKNLFKDKKIKGQMKEAYRKIESGELRPINPRTALKNSLFPDLVKRSIKK